MSRIKGKDTKPEKIVRSFLHNKGFRFVLYSKKLPGTPDIVLTKFKTVIFVNGCFWHGHSRCQYFNFPKTRADFWKNKIDGNKARDKQKAKILSKEGWQVITIWECELKDKLKRRCCFDFVEFHIAKNLSKNTTRTFKKSFYRSKKSQHFNMSLF